MRFDYDMFLNVRKSFEVVDSVIGGEEAFVMTASIRFEQKFWILLRCCIEHSYVGDSTTKNCHVGDSTNSYVVDLTNG